MLMAQIDSDALIREKQGNVHQLEMHAICAARANVSDVELNEIQLAPLPPADC
jgi:hypothetical protein